MANYIENNLIIAKLVIVGNNRAVISRTHQRDKKTQPYIEGLIQLSVVVRSLM